MTTIDKRIVEMGFDNNQFEKGVQSSLKSLDSLKKGLNLDSAVKSLTNLKAAGKSFTLEGISDSVKNISSNFSAFGVMGITVLASLTTAAINFATQLANSMILEPIKKGFAEYESGINAVQTVLANTASKGKTLTDVNAALAEMNRYANLTVYSFGEMIKNIGTFTAAGVDLDVSTKAIEGIGNLAAMSGSNSQQAATAMYQLSQALSSGTVKLMDWNSVVNAGMGGDAFQTALKRTARAHGVAIDQMIKEEGSFRESLSKGWLTSSILTETLMQLTGDLTAAEIKGMKTSQSTQKQFAYFTQQQVDSLALGGDQLQKMGLNAQTAIAIGANFNAVQLKSFGLSAKQIELVLKYTEEANKNLASASATGGSYTDQQVADILALGKQAKESATVVKTFSQMMETLGSNIQTGWAGTWKIIFGDINEAKGLYSGISSVLGGIISKDIDSRNSMLQGWKDMSGQRLLVEGFMNLLEGLANVIKLVQDAFSTIFPAPTGYQLALLTVAFRDLTAGFKFGTEVATKLGWVFKGFFSIFDILGQAIFAVGKAFLGLFPKINLPSLGILDFAANLGYALVTIKDTIKSNNVFGKGIVKISGYIKIAIKNIENFLIKLSPYFLVVKAALTNFLSPAVESIKRFMADAGPEFENIKQSFSNFTQPLIDSFQRFIDKILPDLEKIKNTIFGAFGKKIDTSGVEGFGAKIRNSFGPSVMGFIEGAGKVFLWFKDIFEALAPVFEKIAGVIGTALGGLGKRISDGVKNLNFDSVSKAVSGGLIVALALAIKNFIDKGTSALSGITGILDGVKNSLQAWQTNLKAKTLMTIASAIAILVVSLIALSMVDPDKLSLALIMVSAMFAELVVAMKSMDQLGGISNGLAKTALNMVALSIAVLVLSVAVKRLSEMDMEAMTQGLMGIGVILTELSLFMKNTNFSSMGVKSMSGFILLSVGLLLLSVAVKKFGEIDPKVFQQGLIGIGLIFAEIGGFMKLLGKSTEIVNAAVGITILSGALIIMSIALKALGNLSWEEIAKGLTSIAGALGAMAITMKVVKGSEVIKTAIAITILSGALIVMSLALKAMGNLSWEEIAKGLTSIAGVMAILGIALNAINPVQAVSTSIAITIISAAMLVMSLALKALGNLSWEEIAKGLVAVGGALTIFAVALNFMTTALPGAAAVLVMAAALLLLVPVLFALGSMPWQVIGLSLLALVGLFGILGLAGLVLGPIVPVLYALAGAIALLSLAAVGVGVGMALFGAGLALMAVNGAAAAGVIAILVTALVDVMPTVIKKLVESIKQFAIQMTKATPVFVKAFLTMLRAIGEVLITVIPEFAAGILILIRSLLQVLVDNAPQIVAAGFELLLQLLVGIRNNIKRITSIAIDVVIQFIDGIAERIDDIIAAGFNLILKFIEGLTKAITEKGDLIIEAGLKLGKVIIEGVLKAIVEGAKLVASALWGLVTAAVDAMWKALTAPKATRTIYDELLDPTTVIPDGADSLVDPIINGLESANDKVEVSVKNLRDNTISSLSGAIAEIADVVNSDMDISPTLRPVVDLTDIMSGMTKIDRIFDAKRLTIAASADRLAAVTNGMQASKSAGDTQINQPIVPTSSVSFTQINNSPAYLSRIDIYRQTKTQLLMMKGLVRHT